jgi:signal transduction histidine kinase
MSSAPGDLVSAAKASADLCQVPQSTDSQHAVQFYMDDRFLVRSLAEYVSSALAAGSSAIIVPTKPHGESLMKELELGGVDVDAVTSQGRLVAMDAGETLARFMVDGSLEAGLFRQTMDTVIAMAEAAARRDQNQKVVIFGEMVTLLWERGDATSALRLEQVWNGLSEAHSFRLRCGYPLGSFDREVHRELFSRICGEHHLVIPAESYTDLPDENQRLRTVARLQQIEQILRTESVECGIAREQKRQIENENLQLVGEIRKREAAEEQLRRFTRRLLAARDEEQRRIAAELHENTAQLLAALSLYFGVLHEEKALLNPKLASVIASSRSVSDNLLRQIRKLSHLLHPPTLDDVGLASAIAEYVEQLRSSTKAGIELDIAEDLGRFSRKLETAVFRIVEEALDSIRSTSGGAFARVRLRRSSNALEIEIENHHTGATPAKTSARADTTILGIHERALEHGGAVQFTSDLSATVLRVTLPLASGTATRA